MEHKSFTMEQLRQYPHMEHVREDMLDRFVRYHNENPNVLQQFRAIALSVKSKGKTRYSTKAIAEVIRYDHDRKVHTAEPFKFPNTLTAVYARVLIDLYPDEFTGFFELRRLSSEPVEEVAA